LKIPVCPNCNIKGVALYSHTHGTSKAEGYFCPSCRKYLQPPSTRANNSGVFIGDVRDFLSSYSGPKFDLVLIDPPWKYGRDMLPKSRKTENHYGLMTIEEIGNLPIRNVVKNPSVLFLWATNPLLPEAIDIMGRWGFEYTTKIEWIKKQNEKVQTGIGWNVRGASESLLIGKMGNYPLPDAKNRPNSVLEAPRTRHSEKPELSYLIIERMFPKAKRLEIFGRKSRKGWFVVGNQIDQISMHSLPEKTIELCTEESE
jgi:N6-adenosine-specific RNA methylase IME4